MKKKITKRAVDTLNRGESFADTEIRGFVVRRLPSDRLSYGYRYTHQGRRRWLAFKMGHNAGQSEKSRRGVRGQGRSGRESTY